MQLRENMGKIYILEGEHGFFVPYCWSDVDYINGSQNWNPMSLRLEIKSTTEDHRITE